MNDHTLGHTSGTPSIQGPRAQGKGVAIEVGAGTG
jgi:hypothetical protein